MRQKDNYVMIKKATPKQILLADDRTFVTRYERVSRDSLPLNVTIRRRYKQRAAQKTDLDRLAEAFPDYLVVYLKLSFWNPLFRTLRTVALKSAPVIFDYAKNKHCLNMSGISNRTTE